MLTAQLDSELTRVRIVLLLMIAAFVFLGAVLWRIQVVNVSKYETSLDRQSMRRIRLPGARGMILDRNGVRLADNRPSYCIAVYVEELRQPGRWSNTVNEVDRVITELAGILKLKKRVTRKDIRNHINQRLPLPFLAWKDVDHGVLARWAESDTHFPGVDVYIEPVRVYPMGDSAAHMIGYVSRRDIEKDPATPYDYYLPEMKGKYGLERTLDEILSGVAGGHLIRVDAFGFKHKEKDGPKPIREPVSGKNVIITIDIRIQRLVEEALSGETGSAVVLNPRNGDVLAMASSPSFDPNGFIPSMSRAEWARLTADEGKPFFNRAVTGTYPPGSTFKLLVAIASLENGRATGGTSFECPGYFDLGDARFHCWRKRGHGMLGMRKALEQSCNVYFCKLGLKCGYERLFHMAEAMGFGRKTGVRTGSEKGGLLPDNAWKVRNFRDSWRSGDTCNVSIGQGALLVTPMQMAVFTATIANGGYVYRPRIVIENAERRTRRTAPGTRSNFSSSSALRIPRSAFREGEVVNELGWSAETLRVVRGAMYDVIHAPKGTGKRAKLSTVKMGGKTGTAQYGLKKEGKKHAWMIVFAPFDEPRYAAAMVIEDAVSGGVTVAPRIKKLMEEIFRLEAGGAHIGKQSG